MLHPIIQNFIQILSKLPGLGPRSAKRIFLELVKKKEKTFLPLKKSLEEVLETIRTCDICHNIDAISPCTICTSVRKNPEVLCIVEEVSDVWAIERSNAFKGYYHVLGGRLSPLDGIGPNNLNFASLFKRIDSQSIQEVILAMNATIDGQTTAHYIADHLQDHVKITYLAHGIPIGGELDYLDEGTLSMALHNRRETI